MSKHTATIPVNGGNDRIAALAALYQGEKTDASYLFNTAMAMMGIAVSYVVGAIAFLGNPSRGPMPWLFLLLLPIPLWLIVAFHSLMTLNAMSHGISVRIIEDALFDASGLRVDRTLVGSAAGDKIMDITQEKVVHKVTTFVVYAGVAGLVIGFTVYALYSAQGIVKDDLVWILAIGAYSLLLIMVAASWIVGVRMINKGRREIPEPEKSSGANAGFKQTAASAKANN
jgi:hypothetical protein